MSQKYKIRQIEDPEIIKQELEKFYRKKWRRRFYQVFHFLHCSNRIFCVWFFLSFILCIVYALIIYFALIGHRPFIPENNNLPFFHVPLEYNISLEFDPNFSKNQKFRGKTKILFESTIVTPNFFVNVGENLRIDQLYFERLPDRNSFNSIETGFDSETQMQGYVINHVFETNGKYLAIFSFHGKAFAENADISKPIRFLPLEKNENGFAIIHVNQENSAFGLRYISPSLDSPTFPAKFLLQIRKPKQFQTVSNMPLKITKKMNDKESQDTFDQSIVLFPNQVAFAIFNLQNLIKKNCLSNTLIAVHFRSSISENISSNRLLQLVANQTNAIGKVDGIILPGIQTINQPGISFLNEKDAMIDESSDPENLQDRIKSINLACDKLLNCLHSETAESDERWKLLEKMYEKHVSELAENCLELRTENGKLKHKLAENNTKINAILNENDYLRWENEQFGLEIDCLRNQLDESNLLTKELKAEIKCLQLNQMQINHLHSKRLKNELTSVHDVQTTREEHLKRKIEDLKRQNNLEKMQLQSKIECLEEELAEKNDTMKIFEQKLKSMIKENKKLNQQFNTFKKETEIEMEMLYSRETELEAELMVASEKVEIIYSRKEVEKKMNILMAEKSVKTEKYRLKIEKLEKEIESLRESEGLNSENILKKLNEKLLEIGKFREKIIFLEEELRLEKEQRQNSTILLAQMGKDMKILLKVFKQI